MLCDEDYKCHILDYEKRKSRRVMRSAIASKASAFTETFEAVYLVMENLKTSHGMDLNMYM